MILKCVHMLCKLLGVWARPPNYCSEKGILNDLANSHVCTYV